MKKDTYHFVVSTLVLVLTVVTVSCMISTRDFEQAGQSSTYRANSICVIHSDEELQEALANKKTAEFTGEVIFTSGVKRICGEWRNAQKITIEEGVESFRWDAFDFSKADIHIPSTVSEIEGSFLGAKGDISVSNENPQYMLIDGMLIETSTKTLIHVNYCQTKIIIPKEVEHIGAKACAFHDKIERVEMPYNVKSIGFMAFSDCTALHTIQISEELQELYGEVFFNCPIKQLLIPAHAQFIDEEDGNFLGGDTGVQSLIVMSDDTAIRSLDFCWENDTLKYIAFADDPPKVYDTGTFRHYSESFVIFYLKSHRETWAPNGESEWDGIPIIEIESLLDLPPIE